VGGTLSDSHAAPGARQQGKLEAYLDCVDNFCVNCIVTGNVIISFAVNREDGPRGVLSDIINGS